MNKTTYFILFILTSLVCNSALSQSTITFDDQGFSACIEISDTHVFSAIGKSFNIYAANFDGTPSANGSLWYDVAAGGCWQGFPTEFEDGGFVTAGWANGQSAQQWYAPEALVVKTTDGSDFKFTSFKAHDAEWNSWGNYLKISGYKNGVLQGSESVVIVSDVEPYHSTVILTDPVFGSIDEVRITMDKDNNPQFNDPGIPHSNAEGLFHSFDTFVIDNAVSSATAPTVTTAAETSITATGATLNGEVTADGGATVTERGFVYSTSDNTPNIGEIGVAQVTDGSGIGAFSEAISGLNSSTTYYYQAYATNSAGTAYGGIESFTTLPKQLENFSWSADNLSAGATGVTYTFNYEIVTADPYNILYVINNNGWELPFLGLSGNNYVITPTEKENVTVRVNGSERDFNVRSFSSGLMDVRLTDPTVASGSQIEIIIENVTNKNVGTHHWTWIRTATDGGHEIDGVVSPAPIVLSANAPTISTAAATSITTNGATLDGNITSNGGATVTARGFVYSSTDNSPTIGEAGVTSVADGSGTGAFSEAILGLSASTTYYYQAYATNSAGTVYGGVESFTTSAANTAPIVDANTGLMVTEGTAGNIDSGKLHFNDVETGDDAQLTATITSAVAHGALFLDANLNNTFDGGDEELIVGATFTQDDVNNDRLRYTNTNVSATSDSFGFTLSDPDGGELTNQTFNITINQVPTVTVNNGLTLNEGATELIDSGKLNASDAETGSGSDIIFTITSAVSHGILFIDSNPSTVFEAGDIELVENATFTLDDINNDRLRYTNNVANQAADSFEFKVSDPDGGELTNQTFTITITLFEVPTVTTTAASNVTTTTATLGGNVTANGGLTVTERGIVYNTTGTPTTADTKVQIGSGDGAFSDDITGLTEGTTYFVRAYAINSEGTSYGSEESFITAALGLEDDHLKNAVSLYPNPVNNNVLYIKTDTIKDVKVLLFDVMGKRIEGIKIENDAVNLSNIQTGVYVLKIETELGNLVKRIVKN